MTSKSQARKRKKRARPDRGSPSQSLPRREPAVSTARPAAEKTSPKPRQAQDGGTRRYTPPTRPPKYLFRPAWHKAIGATLLVGGFVL